MVKKALDALKKQALRDQELNQIKGGKFELPPHTYGYIPPETEIPPILEF